MPANKVNCFCSSCNRCLREAKTAKAHAVKEAAAEQSAAEQAERYRGLGQISYREKQQDREIGGSKKSGPDEDLDMDIGSAGPLHVDEARQSGTNKSPVISTYTFRCNLLYTYACAGCTC